MVENHEVQPFNHLRPASPVARDISRRARLLIGHLSSGDCRAMLCNDTYLALEDFYQRVTTCNGGVHALVSGDSPRKQGQFLAWLKKAAVGAGMPIAKGRALSLNALFARMEEWSSGYYRDAFGDHYVAHDDPSKASHRHLAYIGVADLLEDVDLGSSSLLTEFMAYTPDPLGFHFTHPAYSNPLLMAHLRGLQAECLRDLDYAEGVEDFIQQATPYMLGLHMPQELLAQAGTAEGRLLSSTFAESFFGLDETQLICLLFSPFIHHGERLESYLRQCHPGMLVALPELHKVLRASRPPICCNSGSRTPAACPCRCCSTCIANVPLSTSMAHGVPLQPTAPPWPCIRPGNDPARRASGGLRVSGGLPLHDYPDQRGQY